MNIQIKPTTKLQQGRRVSVFILLFLAIMLLTTIGAQSSYANPDAATKPGKTGAPTTCGQLGFSNTTYPASNGPYDATVGDVNNDGKLDIVTPNFYSDDVSVLLGNGNGTFQTAANYAAGSSPYKVVIADLFGDRNEDLVTISSANYVAYLQGAGDGTFYAPYNFDMGSQAYAVAVVDTNNDTYPDIVTASGPSNNVSVRLNDGVGDFEPVTHITVDGVPFALATGDVNNDGKLDLVTANANGDNLSVLLGNGNGSFQSPINFAAGDYPLAVAIRDFNQDGKPDLVSGNRYSNNLSMLLGNGNGLFQPAISLGVGLAPDDADVADFNDDGLVDIVTANSGENNVSILLNNGDGSFQDPLEFAAGDIPYGVGVGDLNNDGKIDILSASLGMDYVSVLLNTCVTIPNTPTSMPIPTSTDTFTPLPTQTPGGPTATPSPTGTACAIQFADVPPANTFYQYVLCLACRGIISGYSCGGTDEPCNADNDPYFRPSTPVSRGQLSKIVSNAAGYTDPVSSQLFEDVVPGSSFYTFVQRLAIHEVMSGYPCGGPSEPCGSGSLPYFRPSSGATRGQLTKIVANAAAFTDPAPSAYTFTDVPVGSTFHVFVERLLLNRPGAMGGYACGSTGEPCDAQNRPYFRPASVLTRGQTSKIIGNTFFPNCQAPGR